VNREAPRLATGAVEAAAAAAAAVSSVSATAVESGNRIVSGAIMGVQGVVSSCYLDACAFNSCRLDSTAKYKLLLESLAKHTHKVQYTAHANCIISVLKKEQAMRAAGLWSKSTADCKA
jgi:exo-beta-1,3-glucanase (GH17 family)